MENIPSLELTSFLKNIKTLINIKKWDKARERLVNNIMKLKIKTKNNSISLFGSESSQFIEFLTEYQKHKLIQLCTEDCIQNRNVFLRYNSELIFCVKKGDKIEIYSCFTRKCPSCRNKINCIIEFHNNPNFLIIQCKYFDIFYTIYQL